MMRNAVRAWSRRIGAVTAASALALATMGSETTEAAPETVVVEVPGPGMPPPAAPWTMAQLTYHPCVVLAESELTRFGSNHRAMGVCHRNSRTAADDGPSRRTVTDRPEGRV
jgi:hypothetical protein